MTEPENIFRDYNTLRVQEFLRDKVEQSTMRHLKGKQYAA